MSVIVCLAYCPRGVPGGAASPAGSRTTVCGHHTVCSFIGGQTSGAHLRPWAPRGSPLQLSDQAPSPVPIQLQFSLFSCPVSPSAVRTNTLSSLPQQYSGSSFNINTAKPSESDWKNVADSQLVGTRFAFCFESSHSIAHFRFTSAHGTRGSQGRLRPWRGPAWARAWAPPSLCGILHVVI